MRIRFLLQKIVNGLLGVAAVGFLLCLVAKVAVNERRQMEEVLVRRDIQSTKREDIEAKGKFFDSKNKTKKMKAVVLVGNFRTGSSFVGQLFNQHPDVFYLFEPLYFTTRYKSNEDHRSKTIEDTLQCNMNAVRYANYQAFRIAVKQFEAEPSFMYKRTLIDLQDCSRNGLCFRHKSAALCTRKMCSNEVISNCKDCEAPRLDLMEQVCSNSKVRVLKVIRIDHLETLRRSWSNQNIDLRIIHLVRDPRSTFMSRAQLHHPGYNITSGITWTCKLNYQMHSQFLSNDPKNRWLKGIYHIVRYEDMIEKPFVEVKRLYDFLNFTDFNIHQNVVDWIARNTVTTDGNLYGTSRNLTKQKYHWRRIPVQVAKAIQDNCKDMMALLGYKSVTSHEQLMDMRDPLLRDIVKSTVT